MMSICKINLVKTIQEKVYKDELQEESSGQVRYKPGRGLFDALSFSEITVFIYGETT